MVELRVLTVSVESAVSWDIRPCKLVFKRSPKFQSSVLKILALKVEAVYSFETFLSIYKT